MPPAWSRSPELATRMPVQLYASSPAVMSYDQELEADLTVKALGEDRERGKRQP